MIASPARTSPPSPLLVGLFARYARRYLARHFHALRLSRSGPMPEPGDGPLVIYCNHPSWWDPMTGFCLAVRLFPGRHHYAPMDAQALARYRFLARVGFFGIGTGAAGARDFLDAAARLFQDPRATLWITPQGQFTDPRQRPVRLKPGLGHLARRLERGMFVPLTLEYPFWEERFAEALARFGEPVDVSALKPHRPGAITALLAARLEAAQDALAGEAQRRRREDFEILVRGNAGVGGVYDLWRRLRARARGERFRPEHSAADTDPEERRS